MRTPVRLDDHLLRKAKQLAARSGRTLTAVIEDALRQLLARSKNSRKGSRVQLPTFQGRGLLPGVDLDGSASLFNLMEKSRDPD